MTTDAQIRDALTDVWLMSLDTDPETWHKSPWGYAVFTIGRALRDHAPDYLEHRLEEKLASR